MTGLGALIIFGGASLQNKYDGHGDSAIVPLLFANLAIGVGIASTAAGVPSLLTGVLSAFVPQLSSSRALGGTVVGLIGLEAITGGAIRIAKDDDPDHKALFDVIGSTLIISGAGCLASGVALIVTSGEPKKSVQASPAVFARPVVAVGLRSATVTWSF